MLRLAQLVFLPLFIMAGSLQAEEFVVPAGKWQMTVTTTNPFFPDPITHTRTECRKRTAFDPSELVQDAQDCQITQQDISGSVLSFSMRCTSEGGELTGDGRYEIKGNLAKGHMDMNFNMQGQSLKMHMDMSGERLGDC